MRSKKLGALLNAVPPATARPAAQLVTDVLSTRALSSSAPPPHSAREVPLQVFIPEHVREQLGIMAARERASLRALILRAVRSLGVEVTDEEIRKRRGRST